MPLKDIEERRSIRKYRDKEIESEKLKSILMAGNLAPTARNRQEWKIVVVKDKDLKDKMVSCCNGQKFVADAGALLVAVSTDPTYNMRCGINAGAVDTALVLQNMTLQATSEGLGTCYIGSFYNDQVKELLGIPQEMEVIQILTLGYPDESPSPRSRRELKETYSIDRF